MFAARPAEDGESFKKTSGKRFRPVEAFSLVGARPWLSLSDGVGGPGARAGPFFWVLRFPLKIDIFDS